MVKIRTIPKKASNKSFSASNFVQKRFGEGICLSPHKVELGGSKDDMVEILNCIETEKIT